MLAVTRRNTAIPKPVAQIAVLAWGVYVLLIVPAFASAYFCTPEKATGFYYLDTDKGWKETKYTTNMYYTISPIKYGKYAYVVKQLGELEPVAYCKNDFNSAGFLLCRLRDVSLKFNKISGRYMMVSAGGYFDAGTPASAGTSGPWLQIGKCANY